VLTLRAEDAPLVVVQDSWSGDPSKASPGFRAQGSGLRAQGSGLRVKGLGSRVKGLRSRVLRSTVYSLRSEFKI